MNEIPSLCNNVRFQGKTALRGCRKLLTAAWLWEWDRSKTPTSWTEGLDLNETHFHRKTKVNQNLYEIYIIFNFFPSLPLFFFFFLPTGVFSSLLALGSIKRVQCTVFHVAWFSAHSCPHKNVWHLVCGVISNERVHETEAVCTHSVLPRLISIMEMFLCNLLLLFVFFLTLNE